MAKLDREERDALTKSRAAIRALRKTADVVTAAGDWWADINMSLYTAFDSAAEDLREQADALESELDSDYPRRAKPKGGA